MSDNNDSSISDLEEDLQDLLNVLPRPRVFRDRNMPFSMYDDAEFKMRFRLSKGTVRDVVELIAPQLEPLTARSMSIDAMNQLLITLRFYATGSFQQTIGDLFNIHQTTACRIVHKVTYEIGLLLDNYSYMPRTAADIAQTKRDFYNIARFPGVIGAADGSHVRILSPGGDNGELYRNRKSWFSINILAVCDAKLRITYLVCRWPGSVHDMTIFNNCGLRAKFEAGEYPNSYLLGDGGYACRSYMLTPLGNPSTPAEERYNKAHITTRNTIERAFGVEKRRFPCLSVGLQIQVKNVLPVIVACTVLHNIARGLNDEEPPLDVSIILPPGANEEVPNPEFVGDVRNNFLIRNSVIASYFS